MCSVMLANVLGLQAAGVVLRRASMQVIYILYVMGYW